MTSSSKKFVLMCSVGAAVLLSGCAPLWDDNFMGGTPRGGAKMDSTEQLLAAEGSWNLVEEEQESSDPISLHKQAKKIVNPSDKKRKQYVPKSKIEVASGKMKGDDVNYRLIRMEREMKNMRDDLNKLLPPLSDLIVADRNLDRTIDELIKKEPAAGGDEHHANKAMMQNQKMNEAYARDASYDAATASGADVSAIRFGLHKYKTRVVMDVSAPLKFSADIDNDEKLMLVDLDGSSWSTAAQKMLKNPLIKGYTAQPSGNGGVIVAFELKKSVKITASDSLKPNSTRGHRIYFDIAPL